MSGENVDRLTAANLKAAFSVLSQAARRVVEGGRIIALSSGTSVVLPPRYGVRATKSHPQSLLGGGIHVRALTEGVREPLYSERPSRFEPSRIHAQDSDIKR